MKASCSVPASAMCRLLQESLTRVQQIPGHEALTGRRNKRREARLERLHRAYRFQASRHPAQTLKAELRRSVQHMIRPVHVILRSFAIVIWSAVLFALSGTAQTNATPERYTATAINMNTGS